MSISDLHLPDLSDVSFSFQIPTDSGHDLLRGDSDDFLRGAAIVPGSPSSHRANDAPLTLSDLTPTTTRAVPRPAASRPPQKATKSLLPTTRSNTQDRTVSHIASRVPKVVPATIGKPKAVAAEKATPLAESLPGTCTMSVAEPVLKRAQSNATSNENSISKAQPAMNNVPSANVAQSDADPAPVVKPPASTEKMEDAPHPASAAEAIAKPLTKSKKVSCYSGGHRFNQTILSGRHLQRNR
jgi:hypothetical protein